MVFLFAPRYWLIAGIVLVLIVVGLFMADACQEANEDTPTEVEGEAAIPRWHPDGVWLTAGPILQSPAA